MNDVFPRRNLNPEAEEWGREVERRIQQAENRDLGSAQSISGLNRSSAASLESLAEQLRALDVQVQRVNSIYNAIPRADQRTTSVSNFGLSAGWNNVASVTFRPPKTGLFHVSATAHGQLRSGSTTAVMAAQIRLAVGASVSLAMPGLPASPTGVWVNNLMVGFGWTLNVIEGQDVTIVAQVNPTDASAWGSGTGSMMVISAFGTFTTPDPTGSILL